MVRLYLDIETFRTEQAFIDEHIIAIGYINDWTPRKDFKQSNPMKTVEILSVWEEDETTPMYSEALERAERKIIKKFVNSLKRIKENANFLEIIGFNILKFDLPLLTQKGNKYGLGSIAKFNAQWWNIYPTDLRQAALPVFSMSHKGNRLDTLIKKAKGKGLTIPNLAGESEKVPTWYKEKEFKKIEQHLKKDVQAVRRLHLTSAIEKLLL